MQVTMRNLTSNAPVQVTYSGRVTPNSQGFVSVDARDIAALTSAGFIFLQGINNLSATSDPGVTDDATAGYGPGSFWLNTSHTRLWICTVSTPGAAAWTLLFQSATS